MARRLAGAEHYIETLPPQERHIATLAAAGRPRWEIAQEVGISDAAVARVVDAVIAAVSGRDWHPVETGGLGADTDPGVTGGYDPAGFGAFDPDAPPDRRDPPDRTEN
jgi:hypothetical protein